MYIYIDIDIHPYICIYIGAILRVCLYMHVCVYSPSGQKINRSHAHAHDSRTHDSRTNHSSSGDEVERVGQRWEQRNDEIVDELALSISTYLYSYAYICIYSYIHRCICVYI